MNKKYQKKMPVAPDAHGLAVPEHVTVAMAEIVGDMREGLLALAVAAGLQVMTAMMEADVTGSLAAGQYRYRVRPCGPDVVRSAACSRQARHAST